MKLFLIGNGFNRFHGMNTAYSDFRHYMINKYEINLNELPSYVSLFPIKRRIHKNNLCKNNASVVVRVIDCVEQCEQKKRKSQKGYSLWSRFEDYLGNICPDTLKYYDEGELKQISIPIEMLREAIFGDISSYLRQWITEENNKLCIIEPREEVQKLINDADEFISFNYTMTLEALYNIKTYNVLHIHGCVGNYNAEEYDRFQFIVGHSSDDEKRQLYNKKVAGDTQWMNLYDELEKDSHKIIDDNIEWFKIDKYRSFEAVIVHGFSYGASDTIYIKKLITAFPNLGRGITWFTSSYNFSFYQYPIIYMKLRQYGFRGRIRFFKEWNNLRTKMEKY